MKAENFRCSVCDTTGNWENVDKYRLKPSGMCICNTCGFLSYPEKYQTEEELKDYYRTKYRNVPQVGNLYSGERKLHYHHFFLKPLFEEWGMHGIDKPVVSDIGAAIGMFLSWLKEQVPGAEITGTELTEGFRKVALYENGVYLTEDFDYTKKYDLISSYHVLEHQSDPDIKLKEYAACLKDNGVFYLSAPVWFRDLNNSATGGFDIEYFWATDHINAWSEEHLEHIIEKAGLQIIHKNTDVYGNTYILKKGEVQVKEKTWDVANNKDFVKKSYDVWMCLQENDPKKALEIHKNCPAAWVHCYELNRATLHKNKEDLDRFLKDCVESCPNSGDALIFAADVLSRYERYDEALELFGKALNKKPNAPTVIMGMSSCYRSLAMKEKDQKKRANYIKKSLDALNFVRQTSLELRDKSTSWLFHDFCLLDMPKRGINEKVNDSASDVASIQ